MLTILRICAQNITTLNRLIAPSISQHTDIQYTTQKPNGSYPFAYTTTNLVGLLFYLTNVASIYFRIVYELWPNEITATRNDGYNKYLAIKTNKKNILGPNTNKKMFDLRTTIASLDDNQLVGIYLSDVCIGIFFKNVLVGLSNDKNY